MISRRFAAMLSSSLILRYGKQLHEQNPNDWRLGDSFIKKMLANIYLITKDYSNGQFPPVLLSKEETYREEREQFESLSGHAIKDIVDGEMVKPFQFPAKMFSGYMHALTSVIALFEKHGVKSGANILELGCGMGWMAEFLAWRGYNVTGTTIAPIDVDNAERRIKLIKDRGCKSRLNFFCAPMEDVYPHFGAVPLFDAVFCFESLHHAFDWKESLSSATKCLRPGGRIFLLSEPSSLHTFISYRSSRILKTHEIGFRKGDLVRELRMLGYEDIQVRRPRRIEKFTDLWKLLVPFTIEDGSVRARSYWITGRLCNESIDSSGGVVEGDGVSGKGGDEPVCRMAL